MPIFDQQPTGSIGALAVAPSDPNVIYVGAGEAAQRPDLGTGDGMYKSTDAGKTWTHLGLRDSQQIGQVVIDPKDANRLFVAALGHPYGPNTERGIFRSTDGGKSFERVLYKDENTGGTDVLLDPSNPNIVYAAALAGAAGTVGERRLQRTRQRPVQVHRRRHDLAPARRRAFRTWEADRLGRIGIGIAPSRPSRLFAIVEARNSGVFRSDDAGETWTRVNSDPRVLARPSDATDVRVHPTNPDIVIVPTIVTWKSTDGGRTFTAIRGAPGGDDYQRAWFNPNNPDIIAMTSDQGAVITLNGGESWSSWYNQPTAAFYHVTHRQLVPVSRVQRPAGKRLGLHPEPRRRRADHVPRVVARSASRSTATSRPIRSIPTSSMAARCRDGIAAPGRCSRSDRGSAAPPTTASSAPCRCCSRRSIRASCISRRTCCGRRSNGGQSWDQISPDLTRKTWEIPKNVGIYSSLPEAQPTQRGVIYTIAPSYLDERTIWVGTDDGLIHVTRDGGKTWNDVTPPALTPWSKVSIMDASHFDANTAYAAINTFRLDDLRPHIYRTRDGGKTWTHITAGIPDGGIINVVREDPKRRGLLFAGTEQAVYVSFDDGEHWQSLRNNMPATSIRDLVIKDDDLVVGTHGRSFYILDDITPLRQIAAAIAAADVHLFAPQEAMRFRWNKNTDTPLPPDEPAGQNPPDGAILHYCLKSPAQSRCRSRSSMRKAASCAGTRATIRSSRSSRAATRLTTGFVRIAAARAAAGLHRFVWDMHHERPAVSGFSYPICRDLREHPAHAAWVMGGAGQIHGAADGRRQVADAAACREDGSAREGDRRRSEAAVRHVARDRRDAAAHVGRALREIRAAAKTPQADRSRAAPVARERAARPVVWRGGIRRRGADAGGDGGVEDDRGRDRAAAGGVGKSEGRAQVARPSRESVISRHSYRAA